MAYSSSSASVTFCYTYSDPWGESLLTSVSNRKGRFVGTMLADRLTRIEEMLVSTPSAAGKPEEEVDQLDERWGVHLLDWTPEVGLVKKNYPPRNGMNLFEFIRAFGMNEDMKLIKQKQQHL